MDYVTTKEMRNSAMPSFETLYRGQQEYAIKLQRLIERFCSGDELPYPGLHHHRLLQNLLLWRWRCCSCGAPVEAQDSLCACRSALSSSEIEWQPIDTADVSQLFATSTWVLIATSEGVVTEAMPYYFDGGGYIWMTARGPNCRGTDDERGQMLPTTVSHWMPLPQHPQRSPPQ
jgi:hypothetical protein